MPRGNYCHYQDIRISSPLRLHRPHGAPTFTIVAALRKPRDLTQGAMISKLFKKFCTRILRARGYSAYFSPLLADEIWRDLTSGANLGFKRRSWGYRHGFIGDSVSYFGLTPENYRDYLPDFHYYKLHPMNGAWSKWIDDKLTFRYILAPFAAYLPKYYFHLGCGEVHRLMDCPVGLAADTAGIFDLLRREKRLAVKLVAGTGGEGFCKLESQAGGILINDKPVSTGEFDRFVSDHGNHIVTEYVVAHTTLRKIFPHTANSVRIWTMHEPGQDPAVGGAFMRFGTAKSGPVDNVSAGGLSCSVGVNDGVIFNPRREERMRTFEISVHPDTGAPIQGVVPHWEMVKAKILQICAYVPQLCYLAFDLVITEDGFKILEINSHQSPKVQLHQPFLKDPSCRHFFQRALKAKGIKIDET
jgi:hypothetical protein